MAVNQEQYAAASYILTFYQDIMYLTHNYSIYVNKLIELEQKQKEDSIKGEDRDQIIKLMQEIRYYCHQTYIKYESIKKSIGFKDDKKIKKLYEILKSSLSVERNDIEDYVLQLNKLLVKDIIKDLLDTSQTLVSQITE